MTFSYRKELMAQVLSIVAESGIHGMEYDGLITSWANNPNAKQSKKFRFSLKSSHQFSGKDFEDYLILASRFGLVERSKFKELEWKHGKNKSAYELGDEVVRLTQSGWEFIEEHDRPLAHRWAANVLENIPTIIISVATALLSGWAIYKWGAPQ